jgi:predicted transcriptional regulator
MDSKVRLGEELKKHHMKRIMDQRIFSWNDILSAVDGIEDDNHVVDVLDQIVCGRIDDGVEDSIYGNAQEESETIQRTLHK